MGHIGRAGSSPRLIRGWSAISFDRPAQMGRPRVLAAGADR